MKFIIPTGVAAMALLVFMTASRAATNEPAAGTNGVAGSSAPTTNVLEKTESTLGRLVDWIEDKTDNTNKVIHLVGKDLGYFYTWVEKDGVFYDPAGVFTITNNMLRISGQRDGYLATRGIYSDYRLVAEFKWGELQWGKHKLHARNSGLMIHATGLDQLWMKGIECQIAEGQTGDVILQQGASLSDGTNTFSRPWFTFKRDTEKRADMQGFRSRNELENPHGEWNTLEIICEGGRVKVMVNGKVTFEGVGAYPNAGRVLIQSNGAEIFFRKLDLHFLHPGKP